MFLGADTIRRLMARLVPEATFVSRPRFSALSYAGPKKLFVCVVMKDGHFYLSTPEYGW